MKYVLVEITQVIQECVQFIMKYLETKIFCVPLTPIAFMKLIFFTGLWLGKSALNKIMTKVANYNWTLEQLMQELRDWPIPDILYSIKQIYEDLSLNCLVCMGKVELNEAKKCLDGTRIKILNEIIDWINNTDAATPCIFWLYGQAGKGKSTITHTIALQA